MILDTNGLSALAEGEPALKSVLRTAAQIAIPVIVLGEYRYGFSQWRNHGQYEQWLTEYLPSFRTLDVDEATTIPARSQGVKEAWNADSFGRRLDCGIMPATFPTSTESRSSLRRRWES